MDSAAPSITRQPELPGVGAEPFSDDLTTVLSHPEFFRIDRIHSGHTGDCPTVSEYDGLPCWRYQVGLSLRVGRCEWWHAATWREAVAKAAHAIRSGATKGEM